MADLFDEIESGKPAESRAAKRSRIFALSRVEIVLAIAFIAALAWGAWVTRALVDAPPRQELVQLQLQGIVGEYLQAQARSGKEQSQAARETAQFMAVLDDRVAALSNSGKVVLVREAVIGGDIPDVTQAVKRQVYAKVAMPRIAQPQSASATAVHNEMRGFLAAEGAGDDAGE